MDVFHREKRSDVMSRIRAKNTKPELAVRQILRRLGVNYRLHVADLPGKPDIVIRKQRVAIQVKGCFWHAHCCLKGRVPGTNTEYWGPKIAGNVRRDRRNERRLRTAGWRVITVWECWTRRWAPDKLEHRLGMFLVRRPQERSHTALPEPSEPDLKNA